MLFVEHAIDGQGGAHTANNGIITVTDGTSIAHLQDIPHKGGIGFRTHVTTHIGTAYQQSTTTSGEPSQDILNAGREGLVRT